MLEMAEFQNNRGQTIEPGQLLGMKTKMAATRR